MELDSANRQGLVLDCDRHAVLGGRGDRQHLGHAVAFDVSLAQGEDKAKKTFTFRVP